MSDPAVHPGLTARPFAVAPPSAHPGDQAARLRAMVESMERTAAPARARTARVIAVASGKGGVGKTNTCVNLSIALAQAGRRVTLLDADLGMANADVLCGLAPGRRLDKAIGVSDRPAAIGTARLALREIAVDAPGGFRLIPGAVGVARMADLSAAERDRLLAALEELESDADAVIVDTGAGVGRPVIALMDAADLGIVVATPEPTSITDAYGLIKCVAGARPSRGADRPAMTLLVNQVESEREARSVHARIAGVAARFLDYRLPLLGWVAQDVRVCAAVRRRRPLLLDEPRSAAARDLRAVAASLDRHLLAGRASPERRTGILGAISRLIVRGG